MEETEIQTLDEFETFAVVYDERSADDWLQAIRNAMPKGFRLEVGRMDDYRGLRIVPDR